MAAAARPRPSGRRLAALAALTLATALLAAPAPAGAACSTAIGGFHPLENCLSISPNTFQIVPGGSVSFALNGAPLTPGVTFTWDFGDGTTLPGQGPTGQSHVYPMRGRYSAHVDEYDAVPTKIDTTNPVLITVSGNPSVSFGATSSTTVKPNVPVGFAATGVPDVGGSIVSYEWDWDGNGTFVPGNATTTHRWTKEGVFHPKVRVTNDLGVSTTSTDPVTITVVNIRPLATLTLAPTTVKVGQAVSLSAAGSYDPDGQIVSYRWDLGGNGAYVDTGGTSSIVRSWPNPGIIRVTLKVVDDSGGTAVSTRTLTVLDEDGSLGGGQQGGGRSGGSGGRAFAASLSGAGIQSLKRAVKKGVAVVARANRSARGRLSLMLRAKDGKALRLTRGRKARKPVKIGSVSVVLRNGRAAKKVLRLNKKAARALRRARGRKFRVTVSGTLTAAGGAKAKVSRVVLLRK